MPLAPPAQFRIDDDYIVDSTKRGNISRFINHSCDVSTKRERHMRYLRVTCARLCCAAFLCLTVASLSISSSFSSSQPNCKTNCIDSSGGKKIVVLANRPIAKDEEITYDYFFASENEKIRCNCGAINCSGRLN